MPKYHKDAPDGINIFVEGCSMQERKDIGMKLKELRENAGLTQNQVAAYLELDQSYLSKIEAGERALSVEQLESLAELYGHDLSFFENLNQEIKPIKLALRAKDLTVEDMQVMATISHIANQCRFMAELLEENHVG
jgi:transcriptional regulator with XRE-family HTH domain